MPEEGIKIFATQLHAHLLGHKLSTVHVKEGVINDVINEDSHYLTHYEEIVHLDEPVKVLPVRAR